MMPNRFLHEEILNMMLATARPVHRDNSTGLTTFVFCLDEHGEEKVEIVAKLKQGPTHFRGHGDVAGFRYQILSLDWKVEDRRTCPECFIVDYSEESYGDEDQWFGGVCPDCFEEYSVRPMEMDIS